MRIVVDIHHATVDDVFEESFGRGAMINTRSTEEKYAVGIHKITFSAT